MTIKQHRELVKLADAHQKADEYLAGHYEWKGGACAVGCSVRDAKKIGVLPKKIKPGDHAALASATDVPELAWRMADHIFEGLPDGERSAWVPRFIRAAKPGRKDYATFPARVMARMGRRLEADALTPEIKAAAGRVAVLWERRAAGDDPPMAEWDAAREQAYAAWQQAYAARERAYAAGQQAYAAWDQAYAAWADFWRWAAKTVVEELEAS